MNRFNPTSISLLRAGAMLGLIMIMALPVGLVQAQVNRERVEVLIDRVGSADPSDRVEACNELAAMGASAKQAMPVLFRTLDDPREEVQSAATRAMGKIDPGFVQILIKRLTHREAYVRLQCARALGRIGSPEATPAWDALRKLAESDPQEVVRREAKTALAALEATGAVDDAAAGEAPRPPRGDEGPRISREALRIALAKAWVKQLSSPDVAERIEAAHELGEMGPVARGAQGALKKVWKYDPDAEARRAALIALVRVNPDNLNVFIDGLGEEEARARGFMAEMLGDMGSHARDAAPALRQVAENDSHSEVRKAAAAALRRVEQEEAQPPAVPRGGKTARTPAAGSEQAQEPKRQEADALPPIAGRWRAKVTYDYRLPTFQHIRTVTWEFHRDGNKLQANLVGSMSGREENWNRYPQNIRDVAFHENVLRFTNKEGLRYELVLEGEVMTGRFSGKPVEELGSGAIRLERMVTFEKDSIGVDLAAEQLKAFERLTGMWEVAYQWDKEIDGNSGGRGFWELGVKNGKPHIDVVLYTALSRSAWLRQPLPLRRLAFDGELLEVQTLEDNNQSSYTLRFADEEASGRVTLIRAPAGPSFADLGLEGFDDDAPRTIHGRVKLAHIPDFAVYIPKGEANGFQDMMRRHNALRERCARGDEDACAQYERELAAWNRAVAFQTNQLATEIHRLGASNMRRKQDLATLYRNQGAQLEKLAGEYEAQGKKAKAAELYEQAQAAYAGADELWKR